MPPVDNTRLRDRRDELDLSNSDLARQLQISPQYLVNILCGSDDPSARLIHRFARVLDLPLDQVRRKPQGDLPESPDQSSSEPKAPRRRKASRESRPRRETGDAALRSAS